MTARIGIIGAGQRLLTLLRLLQLRAPEIEIAAVCDPSDTAVAELQLLAHANVTRYESALALASQSDVNWVLIGSWNAFHASHVLAALACGRHVFCEKPLATSVEDCLAIREALARSGSILSLGFVLRHSPHYQRIKQLIDEGRIGRLISVEANETLTYNHGGYFLADWRRLRSNAGPALLEKCCHDIDLLNWIVASPVRRVASFGGLSFFKPENARRMLEVPPDADGRKAYRGWPSTTGLDPFNSDKDIEDHQVVILEYQNGVKATFHLNCNAAIPERRMYVLGSEGTIRSDMVQGEIHSARIGPDEILRDDSTSISGGHAGGDTRLADELANSILHGTAPRASVAEGLQSTVVCLAIDLAMREGRVVELDEIWSRCNSMLA